MAPVTLPPSFYNSFWSTDYRSGLTTLFTALDQGIIESQQIADFIQSHVAGHSALADTLLDPPITTTTSSSLQHTLLSLSGASSARGQAHKTLANDLQQVLARFAGWEDRHRHRVQAAREEMLNKGGVIGEWEKEAHRLTTLHSAYQEKTRIADESEDDVKFAPTAPTASPDTYTSPKPSTALKRSGTVADRISEKLRQASVPRLEGKALPPPPSPLRPASPSSPTEQPFTPPSEPNGKPAPTRMQTIALTPVETKNPPLPVLLSGLSLSPQRITDLMHLFDAYLLTTPAPYSDASVQPKRGNAALASRQRSSLLGTYEKTFSGEEFVQWLSENLEGLDGDWDRCLESAAELYKLGHLSRTGVGRGFEPHYDTYYTLKSTSTIAKYLNPPPSHIRTRAEANKADEAFRQGVSVAEEKRLQMEQRIERGLRIWEQWERERLAVTKSALEAYTQVMAALLPRLNDLSPSTALSVEAFNPDADLKALIEGNRTGLFRPHAHVYQSVGSDIPEVNFGIDLRRWSGEFGWKGMLHAPKRPRVPDVLQGLLSALASLYTPLDEEERRRSWIYEVPLHEVHALRNSINTSRASSEEVADVARRFNAPIVAGTVKLYLLELDPPVVGWEGWEDAKGVYPAVGADLERDVSSALTTVLSRLTGVQLFVLDAVISHFKSLLDSSDQIYTTKLALSIGRCILRPQIETKLSIGDRTASLFVADLITHYDAIFSPLIEKKSKESDRIMPLRKRTALVDQRISRSRLSDEQDPRLIFEQQIAHREPIPVDSAPVPPDVPSTGPAPLDAAEESIVSPAGPSDDNATAKDNNDENSPTESTTASILDSFDPPTEDQPVASGTGLKRNTSAEVSRLRGPRGARGPRPAPTRVVSTTAPEEPLPTPTERSGGVGVAGDYAPKRGKGATSAGAFGHGSKSSVSAIAAQFEGKKEG